MKKFKMRKLWSGMLLFGMAISCFTATPVQAADTDVPINDTTFPDSVFQTYVKKFDLNNDGSLSQSEIRLVTKININKDYGETDKAASLKGIEYFSELTTLECERNSLKELDVTQNTKLQKLNCDRNQLSSLDVSKNTDLTDLKCRYNQLTRLDVTQNTKLQKLWFYNNQISSIDLSKNTELLDFGCGKNPLTTLDVGQNRKLTSIHCYETQVSSLDVSHMTNLTTLEIFDNQLTSLNISGTTALQELSCYGNNLTSLDTSGCPALTQITCGQNRIQELDVSQSTNLTGLYCANNSLTNLDVSKNTELTSLDCSSNKLTSLPLENNTNLSYLNCRYNRLTSVDTSALTALSSLYITNNPIESLDVSKNANLALLYCPNNQLTSLDISKNTNLYSLDCSNNRLTSLDISKNENLADLHCQDNEIKGLDASNNLNLTTFEFYNNPIMILKAPPSYSDRNLEASIMLYDVVQQNIGQFAGWEASRISDIKDAQLVNNALEFDPEATEVTYTYDCGYNCKLTVYLYIRLNEYQINYELNGGVNAAANPTSYHPVSNVITLEDPVKEGYIFDGWYADEAFTTKLPGIPKGNVGNITLYAKWSETPKADSSNPGTVTPPQPSTDNGQPTTGQTTTNTDTKQTTNDTSAIADDTKVKETDDTQKLPSGTCVTDEQSKAVYTIVENDRNDPSVEYTNPSDEKASTVSIPETVAINGVSYRVTSIAKNAFKNNKKLKKIVIPKTVEKIDSKAFYGCQNLTHITIKSTKLTSKKIGNLAFSKIGSKSNKKLIIKVPKSKKKAYKAMFKKCGIGKKYIIK